MKLDLGGIPLAPGFLPYFAHLPRGRVPGFAGHTGVLVSLRGDKLQDALGRRRYDGLQGDVRASGEHQFVELDVHSPGWRKIGIHCRSGAIQFRDTVDARDLADDLAASRDHELIEGVNWLYNPSVHRLPNRPDSHFLVES